MSADTDTDSEVNETEEDDDNNLGKLEKIREETNSDLLQKGTPPLISFRQDNSIAPNSTATERFFKHKKAVAFSYNESDNILWMIPLDEYDPTSEHQYKISDASEGSFSVRSKPIFDKIDLNLSATYRYSPEWNEKHGALTIDLDQEGEKYRQGDDQ